jgi:preprotein translocase subunit SecG
MVLKIIIGVLILLCSIAIIGVTLVLNTQADTLGAAITGASDTYRGAVGQEEQKRNLIKWMSAVFVGLSLLYTIVETWVG